MKCPRCHEKINDRGGIIDCKKYCCYCFNILKWQGKTKRREIINKKRREKGK